jgi:hypothetical protein
LFVVCIVAVFSPVTAIADTEYCYSEEATFYYYSESFDGQTNVCLNSGFPSAQDSDFTCEIAQCGCGGSGGEAGSCNSFLDSGGCGADPNCPEFHSTVIYNCGTYPCPWG